MVIKSWFSLKTFIEMPQQMVLFSCLTSKCCLIITYAQVCFIMIDKLPSWLQDRPSTKVHAAPGGGSSLGYLFGGGGNWDILHMFVVGVLLSISLESVGSSISNGNLVDHAMLYIDGVRLAGIIQLRLLYHRCVRTCYYKISDNKNYHILECCLIFFYLIFMMNSFFFGGRFLF